MWVSLYLNITWLMWCVMRWETCLFKTTKSLPKVAKTFRWGGFQWIFAKQKNAGSYWDWKHLWFKLLPNKIVSTNKTRVKSKGMLVQHVHQMKPHLHISRSRKFLRGWTFLFHINYSKYFCMWRVSVNIIIHSSFPNACAESIGESISLIFAPFWQLCAQSWMTVPAY